ncbi:YgiQ family radical SAM protein [Vallitalea maricola]|uniref:YgiQ family radical SAM protein n=1 Tax=Vallitalea maricola TaxID=3074433 RepID=A0ACB5UL04_9FIRM|nr:YgiQ family radical SAM protein [Vallitalea sp. AN17-2]
MTKDFLPIIKADMEKRGWEEVDFAFICGDAYVDHPSFGVAIISRYLEAYGYKVGIIPQPRWDTTDDITVFGRPRLGFLVSAGNIDSMVNHYSVAKKKRQKDAYTPGGVINKRPDRATIVYSNLIKRAYKDVPIILGGIEASLRRLAHYDYWSNKVKRSILLDSQGDILLYGMGERTIIELAEALDSGIDIKDITYIKGTAYKSRNLDDVYDYIELPSYQDIIKDKKKYAESFMIQYNNTDFYNGKRLVEQYKDNEYIIQNPPSTPLDQSEMDSIYALPYMRDYHPMYEKDGGIPAIREVKFSLISNRGCFGGCSFCALTFHQGRVVQTRSHNSIINEAKDIICDKDFKGYIHDVGGPTANFRHAACEKQLKYGACKDKQCLFPEPCNNLKVDHSDYLSLLRKLRELPKVNKVFVRSGIRFDYLMKDTDDTFFKELVEHHVSGQLKVAPEHISDKVLQKMGKPKVNVYNKFVKKYTDINKKLNKKQYLVPYLMSSHPGSDLNCAVDLAIYLRDLGYMPEQVQDFYPTPSTLSTCMYYTELDPRTMEKVFVPKSPHEKAMQRALIQYRNPKNYRIVQEALILTGREDLIGYDKDCLIRPKGSNGNYNNKNTYGNTKKKSNKNDEKKKKRKTIRNVHKKKK